MSHLQNRSYESHPKSQYLHLHHCRHHPHSSSLTIVHFILYPLHLVSLVPYPPVILLSLSSMPQSPKILFFVHLDSILPLPKPNSILYGCQDLMPGTPSCRNHHMQESSALCLSTWSTSLCCLYYLIETGTWLNWNHDTKLFICALLL